MAILVNWFEVNFDRKEFKLPFLTCAAWQDSTAILDRYPKAQIVRSRRDDGSIRLYFITGKPEEEFSFETVAPEGKPSIAARVVEFNLGKFFEAQGLRVRANQWGIEATREVHSFPKIGLTIRQGINAKYFADQESKFRHGITLNWTVRPGFTVPISELPESIERGGLPVLLRWPPDWGACPVELAPFDQFYLGTIVKREDASHYRVAVRDESQQVVDGRALYLEARTDVLNELEQVLSQESGQPSVQRRILLLSHSLKPDGRRNSGILRDQLASALRMLDPGERGQVNIPLAPNAEGKMWINCFATGVQRA